MKKNPLFYISPALVVSISLIGIGYAALHSFLNKEWGRGKHDYSEEEPVAKAVTSETATSAE